MPDLPCRTGGSCPVPPKHSRSPACPLCAEPLEAGSVHELASHFQQCPLTERIGEWNR